VLTASRIIRLPRPRRSPAQPGRREPQQASYHNRAPAKAAEPH
jgi:hypothetical protein